MGILLKSTATCIGWILAITVLCNAMKHPCGKEPLWLNVTKEKKVLTSPGWEKGKYQLNLYCIYNYAIPKGKYVLVTFTDFEMSGEVNCRKGYLEITLNGQAARSVRYCGDILPAKITLFSKYDPQMLFQTKNSTQKKGFRMIYQLVDNNQTCKNDEITCRNMNCVKKKLKCNGKDECKDGTDEENCRTKIDKKFICGKPKVGPVKHNWRFRVMGGKKSLPGSWPWMVSLQSDDINPSGHTCGGALINQQWVLTACHCVSRYAKLRIKLGIHNQLKAEKEQQTRYVVKAYPHPLCNPMLQNDIALLKMNAPIHITDTVQPVCLPKKQGAWPPHDDVTCYATGWGRNSTKNELNTPDLYEVGVPLMNRAKCKSIYKKIAKHKIISETNVCTGFKNGGHNPCYGDSGGPLVSEEDGIWTLVGLVSYGANICGDPEPTVYTRVSKYFAWIKKTMKDNTIKA